MGALLRAADAAAQAAAVHTRQDGTSTAPAPNSALGDRTELAALLHGD
ncbi:MAG: hypothetical protein M3460_10020 [Actinomycetota bacterium]|nr:hypothetical protein [Actinomycetota bacterium]